MQMPRGQASPPRAISAGLFATLASLAFALPRAAAQAGETTGPPPSVRLEDRTASFADGIVQVPVLVANTEQVEGLSLSIHHDTAYLSYALYRSESEGWFVEAVEHYPQRVTLRLRRSRRPEGAVPQPEGERLILTTIFTLESDPPESPFRVRTPLSLGSETAVPDIASTHFFIFDGKGNRRPVETLKRSADVTIYYQDGIEVGWGAMTRREQVFKLPLYLTYFKSDRNIFTVGIDYDELFLTMLGIEGHAPPLETSEIDEAIGPDGGIVFELVLDNFLNGPFVHLHVADLLFRYNGAYPKDDQLIIDARLIDTQGLALRAEADGGGANYGKSEPGVVSFLPSYFVRGNADSSPSLKGADPANAPGDLADAMLILDALFRGVIVIPCNDAADANNNGLIEVSDAVQLLNHFFRGGAPPRAPYPRAGYEDPAEDGLDCAKPLPVFQSR